MSHRQRFAVFPPAITDLPKTLTATDRHVLIQAKIERARRHLRDLEAELIAFRGKRLNAIAAKKDVQTGHTTTSHMDIPVLPFNALANAGDVIHNLRSALDHLANQLSWVGCGKEPSRKVEFPIAKDFDAYEKSKAAKVEGMRPDAIKAIDDLKPYRGGNEVLWRIHELDNIDKHRTLFTVAHDYLLEADWMPDLHWPFLLKSSEPHFAGVFDPDVEQDVQLEIDRAVSEPKIASDALLPSLHRLLEYVDQLVVSFVPLLS